MLFQTYFWILEIFILHIINILLLIFKLFLVNFENSITLCFLGFLCSLVIFLKWSSIRLLDRRTTARSIGSLRLSDSTASAKNVTILISTWVRVLHLHIICIPIRSISLWIFRLFKLHTIFFRVRFWLSNLFLFSAWVCILSSNKRMVYQIPWSNSILQFLHWWIIVINNIWQYFIIRKRAHLRQRQFLIFCISKAV